ncbi:MAG: TetR/AcrR family transcriptional regulator [Thermoleophilaceae bacterium]
MQGKPSRAERAEATRSKLLREARELFAERGYAVVGTEEIVRAARVTRGALYHHFRDKRQLFREVHESLEAELVERIGAALDGVEDPLELLETGLRAFLDACTEPAIIRIALIDAPTVLGWEEWREIDAKYGLGIVTFGLQNAMDAGVMARQDVRPLAHIMLGALGEAALLIANADDPQAARKEVEGPLLGLLGGLAP